MAAGETPGAMSTDASVPKHDSRTAVAIIGIGCRFPGGVSDPRSLREFLCNGGDGVREVPPDRYALDLHFDPDDGPDKVYVRRAGFLDQDVYTFDPAPFGISPREADHLDPQQRLLLEVTWEAFEDAGIPIDALKGSATGVFVGGFMLDTQTLALDPDNRPLVSQHTSTGVTMTVLANRLSHAFDLRGPSLTVDTACSASLVATHLACRSLAEGSCDLALAGGANVILTSGGTLIMCKGKFLAPDGRSKAFEAAADGYGRGEGAGVVVLKRLEDALRDGDRVYAVIRGTGINQDGRTDGMAFPNGDAQHLLSQNVCRQAGIEPADVSYVEAHGTGTRAGDPIETRALAATYGNARRHPLFIGSIKSNIGHLEAGAGVAGLIKVATSIAHGVLLPQRRLTEPNPEIAWDDLGVEVVQAPEPWPQPERRIAGINSFGYGGTNAHAVVSDLESALRDLGLERPHARAPRQETSRTFALSADTEAALRTCARELAELLERDPALPLTDLAHTLSNRRSHRSHRAVAIASDRARLLAGLRSISTGDHDPGVVTGRASKRRRVLWTFSGMGPQWWGMAHQLHASDRGFRAAVESADVVFTELAGWSILEEMLRDEASSRMARNEIAQPANLVLQIGLVEMLRERGSFADGHLGHSVGELAAAYAAGCLDLRQAVTVAWHRSQLQQNMAGRGTMLATSVSPARAEALIAGRPVEIAAYNAPSSVALAGDRGALEAIAAVLEAEGTFCRMMPVEVAYHSAQMDPLERGFAERLAFLEPSEPRAPLYSTVTGMRIEGAVHDADYWWANARRPVMLQAAVETALDDGYDLFVQIGPHPVLEAVLRETARARQSEAVVLHTLNRKVPADESVDSLVAGLHVNGGSVRLAHAEGALVDLPRYPFDRQHHWVESDASRQRRLGRANGHPLLAQVETGPRPRWTSDLSAWGLRWIRDHKVDGQVVFPGAGYVEACAAAIAETKGDDAAEVVLDDVRFVQPLVLSEGTRTTMRVEIDGSGRAEVSSSSSPGRWISHATARVHERSRFAAIDDLDLARVRATLGRGPAASTLYERFAAMGLAYSGSFRAIERLWCSDDEVLAELAVPEARGYRLHPAVLDGALQSLLALETDASSKGPVVPISIERVRLRRVIEGPRILVHGRAARRADGSICGDLRLVDDAGEVLAEIRGVTCVAVRPASRELSPQEQRWFHGEVWRSVSLQPKAPSGRWLVIGEDELAHLIERALAPRATVRRIGLAQPWPTDFSPTHLVVLPRSADPAGSLVGLSEILRHAVSCDAPPQTCFLTCGAFGAPGAGPVDPAQTAVVGLARVAMTEHPVLQLRVVDVPSNSTANASEIVAAVAGGDDEEIVLLGDEVLARRLTRTGSRNQTRRDDRRARKSDEAVALVAANTGKLDSLTYRPVLEGDLEADEVEVEVETASLNFKDVMKAMGMLSRTALERTYLGDGLGMEAVGRVVRIGDAVEHVGPGDRVYLWHGGSLATRVRGRAHFVFALDDEVDPLEACCRFVFLTAWHALVDAGRVTAGDRVLIHSAAGGVGLAAIQIAQALGAEIFATAGTPEKRRTLRELGIEHVYDSRTLDFADQIGADTRGEGVDVVLNALAGPAQRLSLELLRDGGRFVEIGKQDIAAAKELSLLPFNRALSFIAVDLDRISSSRPAVCGRLAHEVWQAFATGRLRALPTEVFPAGQAAEAFRRLATGAVIGKVALDFRGAELMVSPGLSPAAPIRARATYLVTGGLGGFGLRTAAWLADRGAQRLVLASRRGEPEGDDARVVAQLRERGVEVVCVALDVCDAGAVQRTIAEIDRHDAPLRGVFHSAMVLEDRPIRELDEASVARVCGPKIEGALNLHRATLGCALDCFVMFSSVSAMVGNPGQGAYAAANAFLDGLCMLRRQAGLPASSVSWGVLDETGVVARNDAVRRHLESMGLRPLPPARALQALGRAMDEDFGAVGIIDIDWSRWRKATAPTPWQRLAELDDADTSTDAAAASFAAVLAGLAPEERRVQVEDRIAAAFSEVLRLPVERIDPERRLEDYGVDSLMAVELQVAIEAEVGVELSTMELLAGRCLRSLAQRVLALIAEQVDAGEGRASAEPPANDRVDVRGRLLERICVQPPYFALDEIRIAGDWLHASADPAPAPECELGPVGVAEAARHLAILGSCAVREADPAAGRIYYPVRSAVLLETAAECLEPLTRLRMRARCTELDRKRSVATALTEILDENERVVTRFEIGYHVIPKAQFQTLFADRARPTHEVSGENPYTVVDPIPAATSRGDGLVVELGPIDPRRCLGHFVGYPAYPVSIMARDAVQLVAEAIRRREGTPELQVRVVAGDAGTQRFVFAGERASVVARPVEGDSKADERWRVEVTTDGEVAAWFEMHVSIARPQAARLSA
jgi:acyl transferase domain-containing protein/NADPH:quinone reductase-like Zn-dependent oxidoreductase/NAD(P)-dependent dehydrogenase (short-subunit alcohol dehydrogenase family)/acyl carrier protein